MELLYCKVLRSSPGFNVDQLPNDDNYTAEIFTMERDNDTILDYFKCVVGGQTARCKSYFSSSSLPYINILQHQAFLFHPVTNSLFAAVAMVKFALPPSHEQLASTVTFPLPVPHEQIIKQFPFLFPSMNSSLQQLTFLFNPPTNSSLQQLPFPFLFLTNRS